MSNQLIYVCEVTLRGSKPKQRFLKSSFQKFVDEIKEVFWQSGIYREDESQPLEKWEWENERQGLVREVHLYYSRMSSDASDTGAFVSEMQFKLFQHLDAYCKLHKLDFSQIEIDLYAADSADMEFRTVTGESEFQERSYAPVYTGDANDYLAGYYATAGYTGD